MIMKLYKYRSFNDKFLNNIITNSSLYFSPIKYFNDPFDCRLSFRNKYSKDERKTYLKKALERNPNLAKIADTKSILSNNSNNEILKFHKQGLRKLIDNIGVLSLSTNYKSILMWSHYANNHNGLVFEFEPHNYQEYDCLNNPMKVNYNEEYELLSYLESDDGSELIKLMLTKHIDWRYEQEYRCIDTEFQGEKKFHKNELKSIMFGLATTNEQINSFKKLCIENGFNHLIFKKAKKVYGKFELVFEKI